MLKFEQFLPSMEFTCYVCHSSLDALFIQQVLLPGLEGTYNFKLFVPDRDFEGSDEVDETLDGMTQSRSVLIVLSQNYLESSKCLFDLAQAFEQRRRYGKRVFAIKLGDIPSACIRQNAKVLELLQSERFVQWPTGYNMTRSTARSLTTQRQKFWSKLSEELYKGMQPC